MSARRGLFLIQDGLGDRPLGALAGRTPLEAADTPTLDRLAAAGRTGVVDIVAPGVKVGTDVGHLVLFGQDAARVRCGRGAIEAAGMGILLEADEIALRYNFATVDPDGVIADRRAGRIRSRTWELARSLNDQQLDHGVTVRFLAATEHRGVVILKGDRLSAAVSDSDPGAAGAPSRKVAALNGSADASYTADLLNHILGRVREILADHPVNRDRADRGLAVANAILTRGAGAACRLESVAERLGLKIACVSGECTVLGMARLAGFEPISLPGMTANLDTDLALKARATTGALHEYDVVYLHVKGPDIAGHDGRPEGKRDFITCTDSMLAAILSELDQPVLVAAGADHATPCELGDHSDDPVPVLLSGPSIAPDSVTAYSEGCCAAGDLGRIQGKEFLKLFFDLVRE